MSNDILAVLAPYYTIPAGAIMRGKSGKDLKIEVSSDDVPPMKEKLVETKPDGTDVFRKAGETTKTSAKLKKEGKPEKKPKPKPEGGKGK